MMDISALPQAILCDRDGTLIEDEHFLNDPTKIRWIDGVKSLLKRFHQAGVKILVITNQSGVARDYFGTETVETIHGQLQTDIREMGGEIADFYYCPHHPDGTHPVYGGLCNCRKPAPGMFFNAIKDHQLTPELCWVIGDRLRDLEPGIALGMRAFLVQTGAGKDHTKLLSEQAYQTQVTVIPSFRNLLTFAVASLSE
ncbi:D-glycero-alpha-D-manno-heptose-1,7-bisphosphate 7-phosphatase (plasmid) [Crocosphaera watsonii WH 8501]|uniref:D,D-heptose 1,7-bisphosphate phosphatase n=1 Tax=Crocosphaera watsonii WH 8501 TaxID=165597 RepID=Q4BYF7_CROWT|nr:HAD family hydrolase [Crocosphaera watsonii]EAM48928.1 Histidinol-phosphate phosphatase:HAD-superfamily hydrolase, subfamily IIIA [Crocosphaera watsonii WH 8501]